MTPAIELRDASRAFGTVVALDRVSLAVVPGEFFALLGPSGSGKTTCLRLIAGFDQPDAGFVLLGGNDVTNAPPFARDVNTVFQDYALFPHMSVAENVAYGPKLRGVPARERRLRAHEMLELVRLDGFGSRRPHELSGGQKQRVALARALINQPKVLLLDEPLGALDKKLREETQIELVNIIHEVGVTCVMVTHDQEEAMTMASRIAVMSEGRFLQVGHPSEIYETPANRFVADFIGNVNLMEGTLTKDEVDHVLVRCVDCTHHVGHGITGTEGMKVAVAIRPEKIRISREAPSPADGEFNRVRGTVKDLAYFGSFTVYHLALASGAALKVSASNTERHRDHAIGVGDAAWASWTPTAQVVLTS